MPADTSWFDAEPDRYLSSEPFANFGDITGVDLADLVSTDHGVLTRAQQRLVDQSIILDEIQKEHGGYAFPLFVYTQCPSLFEGLPRHNLAADAAILAFDMTDSLRRRHIALSHAILPEAIRAAASTSAGRLVVHNLGSGVGLDLLNAVHHTPGVALDVVNIDVNREAAVMGERIAAWLQARGALSSARVAYRRTSLARDCGRCHVVAMIGIICGLPDRMAKILLRRAFRSLQPGGVLVVSSSNHNMKSTDPLASFLIQHIGTRKDPREGWGLNCREERTIRSLLRSSGYVDTAVSHDANYPGREAIPANVLGGVDATPARALLNEKAYAPIGMPPRHVLERRICYNWIAVARKPIRSGVG